MRDEGIVTTRRESQTIWYRIADPRIEQLFGVLYELYLQANQDQKVPLIGSLPWKTSLPSPLSSAAF